MLGYNSYIKDVEQLVPQRDSAPPAIAFSEMIACAEENFPQQELLYVEASDGAEPAVLTLADAERPQMFRGQEVYLLRAADGTVEPFTKPLPLWLRLCDSLRDLHLHNHSTLFLRLVWVLLGLLSAVVIVTGFVGWLQRSRHKKERPPVFDRTAGAKSVPWRLPALFAALSLVGMTAPLSDTLVGNGIGSLAWLALFACAFLLWRRGKR